MKRKKKKLCEILVLGGVALVVVITYAVIQREELILTYIVNTYIPAKQLPKRRVRSAFRHIIGHKMSIEAKGLQGIFEGGRDPGIFVKFEAEPNSIQQFLQPFLESRVRYDHTIDPNYMKYLNDSGHRLFVVPQRWQEKLGVRLFDQMSFVQGRLIECYEPHQEGERQREYQLLIDEEHNTVYLYAYLL